MLEHQESGPEEVAEALDIARNTLEWHLSHLIEQDLIQKQRDSQNRVTLTVPNPSRTVALLEEIMPTFKGRMVDRLTRLVDSYFDE